LPAGQAERYNKYGGGCPTIATTKKRPAVAGLFSLSSLSPHDIRGFAQPRLVEATNAVGEAQR